MSAAAWEVVDVDVDVEVLCPSCEHRWPIAAYADSELVDEQGRTELTNLMVPRWTLLCERCGRIGPLVAGPFIEIRSAR